MKSDEEDMTLEQKLEYNQTKDKYTLACVIFIALLSLVVFLFYSGVTIILRLLFGG